MIGETFFDLIKGMKYIVNTFSFIVAKNLFAGGGSYGGYMINWIQ